MIELSPGGHPHTSTAVFLSPGNSYLALQAESIISHMRAVFFCFFLFQRDYLLHFRDMAKYSETKALVLAFGCDRVVVIVFGKTNMLNQVLVSLKHHKRKNTKQK